MTITTITRDIADDEVFTHKGSVELEGSIGKGAQVIIEDGGLHVQGAIADGAHVEAKGKSGANVVVSNGGYMTNVIVTNSYGVTVNGMVVSGSSFGDGTDDIFGLIVDKEVGNNVKLKSGDGIELKANAGSNLAAEADDGFKGAGIGREADINAGDGVRADILCNGSHVDAGDSVKASTIGQGSVIDAGDSVKADLVHVSASLHGGDGKKVKRYTNDATETAVPDIMTSVPGVAVPRPAAPVTQNVLKLRK